VFFGAVMKPFVVATSELQAARKDSGAVEIHVLDCRTAKGTVEMPGLERRERGRGAGILGFSGGGMLGFLVLG
jgi:hypothetical protein